MTANASAEESSPPSAAGASLAAAREAAGLSIEAVAQQLKLAPRQVRALETGDYTHLPGRTFVRGFIRNYARLLRLDPEQVLLELPGGAGSSALEAPTLHPTAPTIGELPTSQHGRPGWARWAIPALLAAIVIAAAVYEWRRTSGVPPEAGIVPPETSVPLPEASVAPAAPPRDAPASRDPGTTLANPLATAPTEAATAGPSPGPARVSGASPSAGATPAAASETAPAPAGTPPSVAPAAPSGIPAAALAGGPPPPAAATARESPLPPPAPASQAGAAAGEVTVVLTFRNASWTEVRDRDGRLLFGGTGRAGTAQTLSGTPPLALVIGNAGSVQVTYGSHPVDLAPYTRANVARLTLP